MGSLPQLGTDFAGVVTAVGPDVTNHQVGDRVGGIPPNGCWAHFVTCDARLAATLPPGLTDDQAAAVTTAHATAWYGLHDLARISAGDKVLIHSATGGVGQAAIAIARAAGAEIFATAGSAQRRQLLRDMGIDARLRLAQHRVRRADPPRYRWLRRRHRAQLADRRRATRRAGTACPSADDSSRSAKRDVYGNTRLELFPFRRNLTFHYVDLALMADSHPRRIGELLGTVYRLDR